MKHANSLTSGVSLARVIAVFAIFSLSDDHLYTNMPYIDNGSAKALFLTSPSLPVSK